ncbi:glycosyltransferase family 39 protein [bacterium]|nr:glycosyltransferase family 39 protein [bacterium]
MAARHRHARATRKPRPPAQTSPAGAGRFWLAPELLFAVAFVIYVPSLGGMFIWDDLYSIRDNGLLTNFDGLWRIWTTVGQIAQEDHYWPLTYTVLWLEWQSWGAWEPGFHFVNLLVNAAVVVQVWRLMRRIELPGAAFAALLFALHPVHTETVAWVINIKDMMATLCYLVAVELYLIHEQRGGYRWLIATAGVAAAGMLFKSTPITLPAGLAILVWYRRGRIGRRELAELALIGAVVASLAFGDMWLNKASMTENLQSPPLEHRLVQAGWSFWLYVWKLVWPVTLSAIYPQWKLDPARLAEWLPLAAMVVATLILLLARRRIGRGPLACWLFYAVTLGPILGVQYFHFLKISPIADRYQYLASVGPFVGAGVLFGRYIAARSFETRARACGAAAIALAFLAFLTWQREAYFHDPEKLFGQAAKVAPESVFANFNLGCAYLEQERNEDAERIFRKTVDLKPDYWDAVCNLETSLCLQEEYGEALAVCRKALAGGCNHHGVLNNMAEILLIVKDPALQNPAEALDLARRSLEGKDRDDPYYMHVYAKAQLATGRREEGIATARRALERARAIGATQLVSQIETTLQKPEQKNMLGRGEFLLH